MLETRVLATSRFDVMGYWYIGILHPGLHTNLYLPYNSFHHPAQKVTALATSEDRAYKIAVVNHLQEELNFLKDIFIRHVFDQTEIHRMINGGLGRSVKEEEKMIVNLMSTSTPQSFSHSLSLGSTKFYAPVGKFT